MTNAPPAKRRGRPRAYDPDVALREARDTFWRAGYAATSLDDLAADMGMNRPSIYAAFGDKRALYLRAVTEYADASRAALTRALAEPRSLRDGLRIVYRDARAFYRAGDDAPRGCFLIGTAVTEANRDPLVRSIVESTFAEFTAAFTGAVRARRTRPGAGPARARSARPDCNGDVERHRGAAGPARSPPRSSTPPSTSSAHGRIRPSGSPT